jgi:hypothetical protein
MLHRAEAPEKQAQNGESPDGMTVEALCKPPTVDDSRWGKMAPGPGCFGEVPRPVEPRARERAGALGESRSAELNVGLGAMFAA